MSRAARSLPRGVFPLVAALLPACDVSGFDNYRQDAPVVVLEPPTTYPAGAFGAPFAVASDDGAAGGEDWVVASGGLGTPVVAMALRAGSALRPTLAPWFVCGPGASCGDPARVPSGAGVGAVASWRGATTCGLTGMYSTAVHTVQVRCRNGGAEGAAFTITPPPGFEQSGFGLVLASPRRRNASDPAPGDLVFVQAGADPGYVFAAQPGAVDAVTPQDLVAHAQYGEAMSVGYLRPAGGGGPTDLLLAVGAPGMRAVFAFVGDPRAGRAMRRVGCVLRGADPGFGGAVATGDLDGDGRDDVVVGARAGETGRRARVHVFLARDLPTDASCSEAGWPEAQAWDCAGGSSFGVECEGGDEDFGGALAAGDLDGDGRDEVIVGGARADALGVADSGAAWVYQLSLGAATPAAVLRASSPMDGAHLGAAVVVAKLGTRDEALLAEPGQRDVRAYLCSGLPGDSPDAGRLNGQCR